MKQSFNEGWICYPAEKREEAVTVCLPHDAMQLDQRSETSAGGTNTGWYEARDYIYEKKFYVPAESEAQKTILEFEGVYRKATVYLNGKKAAYHSYGYTGFYVDAAKYLNYGEENEIRVEALNSDQPNSRWYSGTGIYRPVWMHTVPKKHLRFDSIRICTLDYKDKTVEISGWPNEEGKVKIEIMDKSVKDTEKSSEETKSVLAVKELETNGKFSCRFALDQAELWSPENPRLYTCRVTFGEDVQEQNFGIRTVSCTPEEGFCINGKRILLKGGCIHHDNGILGSRAYGFAERRKIQILKDSGFNAIRSAHNPCSKALLAACDEMGMLVMDEYIDGWYIHKTKYDYADEILENYQRDLRDLVDKDYNHPSVVLYSIGNEVSETAQKKGIALTRKMTQRLHELDGTRPVTCGVNIFFNFLSSVGFGIYSDKKAEEAAKNAKKKKAVGSEFYNKVAGILGADFMKTGATIYPCDLKTRDAYAAMDVAGYNYGIKRYQHDLKKYPNRMIVGSETFCSDAYRFMQEAKTSRRLIGDFVWAAMDYLGEVGIGSWEYKEYAPTFDGSCGWSTAGAGRIDITGKPLGEMSYMRAAFGLEDLAMAVVPVTHTKEEHSPSSWKMSNAIESWSWNGCEGKKARVEVYSQADHVKLFVNNSCVGTKSPKNDCKVAFETIYHDGELKAVAYDKDENKIAEKILKTAGEETILSVEPEMLSYDENNDLCYVRLRFTDQAGQTKPIARDRIKIQVEGAEILASGSACPYYPETYLQDETDTYYGEAQVILKPLAGFERIRITASSDKYGTGEAEVVNNSIC